jgi:sodium/proline symporter
MLAGVATAIVWRFVLNLSGAMYEVLPGMIAGFAVYAVGRAFSRRGT